MTTFLATFVIFLGASAALALGRSRGRSPERDCGGCTASEVCKPSSPVESERT